MANTRKGRELRGLFFAQPAYLTTLLGNCSNTSDRNAASHCIHAVVLRRRNGVLDKKRPRSSRPFQLLSIKLRRNFGSKILDFLFDTFTDFVTDETLDLGTRRGKQFANLLIRILDERLPH